MEDNSLDEYIEREAERVDAELKQLMKIQQIELTEKHRMKPVTYIPPHAKGDAGHKNCERGYITSWNDKFVFVRYYGGTSAATDPKDLIWG